MSVPGFTRSETSWRSPLPGWTAPVVDPRMLADPITASLEGVAVGTVRTDLGDFRRLSTLDGWWTGPDVRAESVAKPDGDGDFEGVVRAGARPLQLGGLIVAPDRRTLLQEMEQFGTVLWGASRYGTLVVTEKDLALSRQCRVRSVQAPDVVPLSDRVARWSWFLRAADPIRYDAAAQSVTMTRSAADQMIQNTGKAAVPLTVTLRGPLATPSVWINSVEWRLNTTIAAGETVIAYWKDREVWKGSSSLRFYQAGPWTWAQPGVTRVGFTGTGGAGTATISWRSGWL